MKKKILLIEDEPGHAATLQDRLQCEGYSAEVAPDGEGGLQRATRDYFDLIILDVMAPGKSGLEVCRELRQQCIAVPILMLSARSQTIDKVLGLKIGADDTLRNPSTCWNCLPESKPICAAL